MDNKMIKNIVAFCLLMENENGIQGKSPDYIREKFSRYCLSENDEAEWGLDSIRTSLLKKWTKCWLPQEANCDCYEPEPDGVVKVGEHEGSYQSCKKCLGKIWK